MTPAQARAFHAVAVEGTFTAAARRLSVSQPSVTNHVKQLERLYGIDLFHRSSRGVRLTPVGADLFAMLRSMFGSYQEAIEFLQETGGKRRGHLRVGSYGPYAVIEMLSQFSRLYPGIEISLAFGNSLELEQRLLDYQLDVGVFTRTSRRADFCEFPYRDPPAIAILPREPQQAFQETISVAQLLRYRLIRRESGSAVRTAEDRMLREHGESEYRTIEIGSREGVITAVCEGLGGALIFDEGFFPTDRLVKLRFEDFEASNPIGVICLAERRASVAIRAFLTLAKGLAGNIDARS